MDLVFAAAVAKRKEYFPELILEAALPYAGRMKTADQDFHELLAACDRVRVERKEYRRSCYMERNRYMVESSQKVIAVYDGRTRGGTFYTVNYARALGRDLKIIAV